MITRLVLASIFTSILWTGSTFVLAQEDSRADTESPAAATWTTLANAPPASVGAMLLLTDGRVLVHEEPNCNSGAGCVGGSYYAWLTLTPDITGSYINGAWSSVAELPYGYAPLFFASAVLADGNVVIEGGEYNCAGSGCTADWQSAGALWEYGTTGQWASTDPASYMEHVGDAPSVVLPSGTFMVAACCSIAFGDSTYPQFAYFNESSLHLTAKSTASDGKADDFDQEGWTLLPNNKLLTIDTYTTNTDYAGLNSELYNPSTLTWATAGNTVNQLWDSNCSSGGGSFEVGPALLRPNGTLFATGASDCAAGHTAIYNYKTNAWTAGPDFPSGNAANGAPAAVETNGNVLVMTSPADGTFAAPSSFYNWTGAALSAFPNPSNAANDASYAGHLLVLPTGQIIFTDFSTTVQILTTSGTYLSSWQPTITTAPSTLTPGATNSISGTQFNGLTSGSAYGSGFQNATNYPLLRIVNVATQHVFYAKTHGHSTMAVATGSKPVSTNFDVPLAVELGPCQIFVVANGIPSAPANCTVSQFVSTTTLTSSMNPSPLGQSVTFTATVAPNGSPAPTGTVSFTVNGNVILGCGSVAVSGSGRTAQCSTTFSLGGTYSIVATYSGDTSYAGSISTTLSQVVSKIATSAALASNLNPSTVGATVGFSATISPAPGPPTGTVNFTSNGTTISGCGAVTIASGVSSCSTSFSAAGTYSVVAIYSGNAYDEGSSSSTLSQVVDP